MHFISASLGNNIGLLKFISCHRPNLSAERSPFMEQRRHDFEAYELQVVTLSGGTGTSI